MTHSSHNRPSHQALEQPSSSRSQGGRVNPHHWDNYTRLAFWRLSPLYHHLSEQMASDPEMQAFKALVPEDQPTEVTFFTAVNEVLYVQREREALAAFYPTLTPTPRPAEEAYPVFKAFCLKHASPLRQRLPRMRLQTNEISRCASLLPAFQMVFQRGGCKPLALVELGCSAGLNLFWDQYRYYYLRDNQQHPDQPDMVASLGNLDFAGAIRCTLEGAQMPPLPTSFPPIAYRIGIDVSPLGLSHEQDVLRLRACIWPEEVARYHLLREAVTFARSRQTQPLILTGNASAELPAVLEGLSAEVTICIVHSYALQQGPAQERERVLQVLEEASAQRDLYRISLEMNAARWRHPRLELFQYHKGHLSDYAHLADCEVHGERMRWMH